MLVEECKEYVKTRKALNAEEIYRSMEDTGNEVRRYLQVVFQHILSK